MTDQLTIMHHVTPLTSCHVHEVLSGRLVDLDVSVANVMLVTPANTNTNINTESTHGSGMDAACTG